MSISDEAVNAAAQAIGEVAHTRDFHVMAESALEAATPHLIKNMRRLSLYEIEMRDNPERMNAMRRKMREEAKTARREQNKLRAEHFRRAQESAFKEGMLAQFEADLLHVPGPQNPYTLEETS